MFLPQRACGNLKLGITVSLYYKNEHTFNVGFIMYGSYLMGTMLSNEKESIKPFPNIFCGFQFQKNWGYICMSHANKQRIQTH